MFIYLFLIYFYSIKQSATRRRNKQKQQLGEDLWELQVAKQFTSTSNSEETP